MMASAVVSPASTFFLSFLLSFTSLEKMEWGLPICEQRVTRAPASSKYFMVGSAP